MRLALSKGKDETPKGNLYPCLRSGLTHNCAPSADSLLQSENENRLTKWGRCFQPDLARIHCLLCQSLKPGHQVMVHLSSEILGNCFVLVLHFFQRLLLLAPVSKLVDTAFCFHEGPLGDSH